MKNIIHTASNMSGFVIPEMRSDFLSAIPKGNNPKLRGVFIDVVHHHTSLQKQTRWSPEKPIVVHNLVRDYLIYIFIYVLEMQI